MSNAGKWNLLIGLIIMFCVAWYTWNITRPTELPQNTHPTAPVPSGSAQ